MERLVELVWPRQQNVIPGLIVTDDDRGLAAAIAKVFPDVPHTLCAWHIRKNFVAKISKAFSKTSDEFIMLCDYSNKLIWTRDRAEFEETVESCRKEVRKGPARKGGNAHVVEEYLDKYVKEL